MAEGVARLAPVRNAPCNDAGIVLDANSGTRTHEATRFGRAVEKYTPYWIEEQLMPDHFSGGAKVRQTRDVPTSPARTNSPAAARAICLIQSMADILDPDVVRAGGPIEHRMIAASARHIHVAPHGPGHTSMQSTASIENGLIIESYPRACQLQRDTAAFRRTG